MYAVFLEESVKSAEIIAPELFALALQNVVGPQKVVQMVGVVHND